MSKYRLSAASLVTAIPAGFLAYILVMAFLQKPGFNEMRGFFQIISGLTLLMVTLVVLMPLGILIFGKKSDAAPKAKPDAKKKSSEDEDEDLGLNDEPKAKSKAKPKDADEEDIAVDEDLFEEEEFADEEVAEDEFADEAFDEDDLADDDFDAFDDFDDKKKKK